MTIIGDAYIAVKGDTKGFEAGTEKGVLDSVSSLAKKAAVIFGGAFVAQKAWSGISNALLAGEEAASVFAQTEAVIASTGGAANITAEQMDKLAGSISVKTGIDDEAILSAQNLLATFTNVRNEVGAGNDIFTQATQAATDMGAALKNGPEANAKLLGKALNDPIAGLTALSRTGVQFSDAQKQAIKDSVAAGDTLTAQKVILKELEVQFGGSAEAVANDTDKIKVAFGNLQEGLGQAIAPALSAILPAILDVADALGPVVEQLGTSLGAVLEAIAPAIGPIAESLIPIVASIGDALASVAPVVAEAVGELAPLLAPIAEVLGRVLEGVSPLLPIIAELAATFGGAFLTVVEAVLDALEPLLPIVMEVAEAFGGTLGRVLEALAPVIADVAATFGDVLAEVLPIVADAILAVLEALEPLITPEMIETLLLLASPFFLLLKALQPVIPVIAKVVGVLGDVIASLAEELEPIMPAIIEVVQELANALGEGLAQVLEALAPALPPIAEALGAILLAIIPLLPPLLELVTFLIEKLGVPVLTAIAEAIALVATALAGIITWVAELVGSLTSVDFGGFVDGAGNAVGAVVGFFTELPGKVIGFVADLVADVGAKLFEVVTFFPRLQLRIITAAAGLFKGVIDEAAAIPGKVMEWLGKLPEELLGLVDTLLEAGTELGGKILEGLGAGLSAATDFVGDIAGAVRDALVGLINDLIGLLNDGIPNKLGWGRLSIDIPDDPIPTIALARGGIIRSTPGGVPVTAAEAGVDEAFMPLLPGVLDGLRAIAEGNLAGGAGLTVQVERMELTPGADPQEHALEFLDGIADAAWLAGVGG